MTSNEQQCREAFDFAMESFDGIAKDLAIGCQQATSNEIWNAIEQAKAAWNTRTPPQITEAMIEAGAKAACETRTLAARHALDGDIDQAFIVYTKAALEAAFKEMESVMGESK